MKRPPGLWLLLSAGVLWLSLHDAYGLKATALIFGKTSTTTTSTETPSKDEQSKDLASTESPEESTTKSNLTGNPQIDYLYDPNLPRELNGYNLSSYPFYNSMPEDIDFKCDGLHDGFYASVPHKCQVYHHCLFGTRYDFLCANYTAFDQKTFICHFVSEVDCNNSHKYWHRNDALYQVATTTTPKPTTVVIAPALTASPRTPPTLGRRRKPTRRPAYDYYDEDYDEDGRDDYYEEPPPRRRRKRPRPRPRPVYVDDYEDYEDDRYERRTTGRHNDDRNDRRPSDGDRKTYNRRDPDGRRPLDSDRYDRRESNRNRGQSDERREYDYDRKSYDDRRVNDDNRKFYNRREPDDRRVNNNDRKSHDRRDYEDRRNDDRLNDGKRPKDDSRRDSDERSRYDDSDETGYRYDRNNRRQLKEDDRKRHPTTDEDDRKNYEESRYDRRRKTQRRPYDDEERQDDRRPYDRPRNASSQNAKESSDDVRSSSKPNSGTSIYNQPRMPPRIKPPIPKNEQNKLPYKPTTERPTSKAAILDDEYYEEETLPKRSPSPSNYKPEPEIESRKPLNKPINLERDSRRPSSSNTRSRIQMFRRPVTESAEIGEDDKFKQSRPQAKDGKVSFNNRNRQTSEESSYNSDHQESRNPITNKERNISASKFVPKEQRTRNEYKDKSKIESTTTVIVTSTTTPSTTTTREPIKERPEPVVRIVKRPFLPSRGGSPYSSRGLQPVGAKALDDARNLSLQREDEFTTFSEDAYEPETSLNERRPIAKDFSELKQNYKPDVVPSKIMEDPYKNNKDEEEPVTIQNGRQFPSEPKVSSFLINEEPFEDDYKPRSSFTDISVKENQDAPSYVDTETKPEEIMEFKPSPVLIKVPVRIKFSDPIETEDDEEFKPVSNRPQPIPRQNTKPKSYKDPRPTEKPMVEKNPLDIDESEYDVTLNDALNPTIPNLPIRNFPTGFSAINDYTFSTFQRPRYDITLNQASENRYQLRSPSQKIETVVQPYFNSAGKKYISTSNNYNTPPEQIYQNYKSSPQITQAQTHSFYSVY